MTIGYLDPWGKGRPRPSQIPAVPEASAFPFLRRGLPDDSRSGLLGLIGL